MSTELAARKARQLVAQDAKAAVARETDTAIVTPHYTMSALEQMGWQRSKGESRSYRAAFSEYFARAWLARYHALMLAQRYNRPCASSGLTSYRYRGQFGWVMIGATDDADALREAARSIDGVPHADRLEIWSAQAGRYVPAESGSTHGHL